MKTLRIRVKPNARDSRLIEGEDGSMTAQLKAPPVDGKANDELVALLAERFGCRRSAVTIRSGASARTKLVCIDG